MNESGVKASVIIPTRNRSHCLPLSVASVLAQEYGNFEVIIVNDGSTDDTEEVVRRLAEQDSRIRTLQQPGMGQSAAVNRGLEEAQGEIAIMLSDDDLLYPGCLAAQVPLFEKDDGVVVVTGDFDLIDWDENVLHSVCSPEVSLKCMLLDHQCSFGAGVAFRVDAAKRAGGWDTRYRHAPDLDFWMRMALQGKILHVPEKIGGWRQHSDQISAESSRGSLECAREHVQITEEFFEREDLPEEFREMSGRARSAAHVVAAFVLDPGHLQKDRRFLIVDRASLSLDDEGRISSPDDVLGRMVKTADERLQLIHSLESDLRKLESTADERLTVMQSLEKDLKQCHSMLRDLSSGANEGGGHKPGLLRRMARKFYSFFQK